MSRSPYDSMTFGNTLSLRVDSAVSAISLSPNGRDAVLAGRKGLYVVDMDDPFSAPRWIQHATSWEVADVQWSRHAAKPSWVVSTSNQKAMVWNLARSSSRALEHVLHRHVRAITDINFHPTDPEILATCSVDTFTFVWDMRAPRKPCHLFPDWRTAATQVKWSYADPHVLASSHENYFYIWDTRKGAKPLHTVQAHTAKINGLDFSKTSASQLISCSNDMTVKIWDYETSIEKPAHVIRTEFPVARARYLPFGDDGCGILPLSGGSNAVYIANYRDSADAAMKPTYVFKGHSMPVRDFLWRERYAAYPATDDREFQLVTWAKDRDLRLWKTNDELYARTGLVRNNTFVDLFDENPHPHDPKEAPYSYDTFSVEPSTEGVFRNRKYLFVSKGSANKFSHLDWISGVRIGSGNAGTNFFDHQPANLGEEVSLVGHKFPKIRFEKISVSTGRLVVSLNGAWSGLDEESDLLFIRVEIDFPPEYPALSPRFAVEQSHELSAAVQHEMALELARVADTYAERSRFSLEACLRCLMGEKLNLEEFTDDELAMGVLEDAYDYAASSAVSDEEEEDDEEELVPLVSITARGTRSAPTGRFDSTPVPKGCGAVWTRDGGLLCFFVSKVSKEKNVLKFDSQGFGIKAKGALANLLTDSLSSASSASSDSFDEDWNDILVKDGPKRALMPGLWNRGLKDYGDFRSKRPGSLPTERSLGTTTSSKNTVRIFDYSHLIPDKIALAREYRILGDSPEVLARYNAEVARAHGFLDIADCWRVVAVLLTKDVDNTPDGLLNLHPNKAFPEILKHAHPDSLRFFWGGHPFGRNWLVREIFRYYERLGNVQMLAMLSCVLYENAETIFDPSIPISVPFKKPVSLLVERTTVVAVKATPAPRFNSLSGSVSSYASSVKSGSPERFSRSRKHISSAQSFVDPFALFSPIKKEGITSVLMGRTMSDSHARDGHSSHRNDSRHDLHIPKTASETSRWPEKKRSVVHTVLIQMLNETVLDVYDTMYISNLLDAKYEDRYTYYREEYSDLLYAWGLPSSRVQVLKFNYTSAMASSDDTHKCGIGLVAPLAKLQDCHYCGLRIRKSVFVCNVCEHVLHASCATEWWDGERECPSGCGCLCLEKML
ncbi:hypothetical protein BABINDRAFT_160761 [Babjeviella inositovora NRRL Y-12698]|uniref:Uncharacterized protein n=1 Tax=Babjeviella inositovora NRRL Y-12698 TaxID=984486 RepID=A0A1E3QU07_9ASCO|nr:uncharacterized protein BABINDRAFT_160761 [Babjeviella inositovora NRRL Y-12698]ODQ80482.1 hypothetical protein BABINDRAFT_160761 [Babjeviella inositovora NRRL Y-12698]